MKLLEKALSVLPRVVQLDRLVLLIVRYRSTELFGRGGPT